LIFPRREEKENEGRKKKEVDIGFFIRFFFYIEGKKHLIGYEKNNITIG